MYARKVYYALPLDEEGVRQCGNKLAPIEPALTGVEFGRALVDQMPLIVEHVRMICDLVWPETRPKSSMYS